eukprot:2721535-Rhodomonas_salina.3
MLHPGTPLLRRLHCRPLSAPRCRPRRLPFRSLPAAAASLALAASGALAAGDVAPAGLAAQTAVRWAPPNCSLSLQCQHPRSLSLSARVVARARGQPQSPAAAQQRNCCPRS